MPSDLFSLRGRTALVTGARTGIGQAIAIGLAEAGADLVLIGHEKAAAETAAEVAALGRGVEAHCIDLSEPDGVPAAVRGIIEGHRVDIVVNNAGIIRRHPAVEHPAEAWQEVVDVNLTSLFLLTQCLAGPMLDRGHGKVVNIASLLSFQGGLNVVGYAATKHGVAGLTKALANEWGPQGVQVNAIAPGYIETANTAPLRADAQRNDAILARIPAGRWGRPDDLVGAAVFLASGASDYVNGHILTVDGGWMGR